jgi:adenylate cyclase
VLCCPGGDRGEAAESPGGGERAGIMVEVTIERPRAHIDRIPVRRLRLASGLVLFTYLITHFLNHALGNISLSAMMAGAQWFLFLWRGPIGTGALYGAALVHLGLGLWALYERRHFYWRGAELAQLLLGLAVPFLLLTHLVETRIAWTLYGHNEGYPLELGSLWVNAPERGWTQSLLLIVAWCHGCIGLHYWLRLKRFYRAWSPLLLAAAVLLPAVALLGFVQGGREVERHLAEPGWAEAMDERGGPFPDGAIDRLDAVEADMRAAYLALLALALAGRAARTLVETRRGLVRLHYPDGREVRMPRGMSVLDASRSARIPHASVCGGRGRCSTCRIRVVSGLEHQPPPSAGELAVLQRVGADKSVRLACQLKPVHEMTLIPLLPASATAADGRAQPSWRSGQERPVAILFIDLRGSTALAEGRLPYDMVFLVNRYFEAVGSAIVACGGMPNQFIGDGVMALFGIEAGLAEGCRQALAAVREIARRLEALNRLLAHDLREPLRFGIGVHAGTTIIGEMGYGPHARVTAMGDPVNVAARLEELTKQYKCLLVVSETVGEAAGISLAEFDRYEIQVRGRSGPLAIHTLSDPETLPL